MVTNELVPFKCIGERANKTFVKSEKKVIMRSRADNLNTLLSNKEQLLKDVSNSKESSFFEMICCGKMRILNDMMTEHTH